MDRLGVILAAGGVLAGDLAKVLQHFDLMRMDAGQFLAHQGQADGYEYVVISGRVRSMVSDAEGREVCLGLYQGPSVIAPNIARSDNGVSLVDIEVLSDSEIARIPAKLLMDLMVASASIRDWGNGIMRQELQRKMGREWALSALDAAGRLAWFRTHYPGYEDRFSHGHIASFLGMTPVTMSRARGKAGSGQ